MRRKGSGEFEAALGGKYQSTVVESNRPPLHRRPIPTQVSIFDGGIGEVLDHDTNLGFGPAGLWSGDWDHSDPGADCDGFGRLSVRIGHSPYSGRVTASLPPRPPIADVSNEIVDEHRLKIHHDSFRVLYDTDAVDRAGESAGGGIGHVS